MAGSTLLRFRGRWRLLALPLAALLAVPATALANADPLPAEVAAASGGGVTGAGGGMAPAEPVAGPAELPGDAPAAAAAGGMSRVEPRAPLAEAVRGEAQGALGSLAAVGEKNKSGVNPSVLKLPQSGASVKGMGETFAPDLNTGTAAMSVPIVVPPGRLGHEPKLALSYSSGGGSGPFGLGWSLGVPSIQRRTDKGLPTYGESDRFMFGEQELVEVDPAGEALPAAGGRYYRQKIESSYARFFRRDVGLATEHWVAQDKDGTEYRYEAGVADGGRIFRWNLVAVLDVHGNRTEYHYRTDGYGKQTYLENVLYNNVGASSFQHRVHLAYEARADVTTSYLATFGVPTALRATSIEVSTDYGTGSRRLVRRYVLAYQPTRFRTLLQSVQLVGNDGTTSLPALTFEYGGLATHRDVDGNDTGASAPGFGGLDGTVYTLPQSPSYSIDDVRNELLDVDADGLPDLLFTDVGRNQGSHSYVLNDGGGLCASRPDLAEACALPNLGGLAMSRELLLPGVSSQVTLLNSNAQLLDVDADGRVELLHMPHLTAYSYYKADCAAAGGASRACAWQGRGPFAANPDIDLTRDAVDLKLLDANGDRLIDVVRTAGTQLETYLAQKPGGTFGAAVTSCVLYAGGPVMFSDSRVKLADLNGDGLTDIVLLRPNNIVYWPNRGPGVWGDGPAACPAGTFAPGRERPMAGAPWFLEVSELHLGDVNGDGLADLVRVRADAVDVWLNRGDESFAAQVTIARTPFHAGFTNHVRFADLNGTATPDIVWGDAGDYRFMDLAGGERPGLLTRYANGLGKVVDIEYRPSTSFYLDDRATGYEWADRPPFPTPLVYRVTTSDSLGSPAIVTRYHYRDGVYDGVEHEFRGFRYVETWSLGDDHSPTSVVASYFHKGDECLQVDDTPDPDVPRCADGRLKVEALKNLLYRTDTYQPAGDSRAEDNRELRRYKSVVHTGYNLAELYRRAGGGHGSVVHVSGRNVKSLLYAGNAVAGAWVASAFFQAYSDYELTTVEGRAASVYEPSLVPGASSAPLMIITSNDRFGNEWLSVDFGRPGGDPVVITRGEPVRNEARWIHRRSESWITDLGGLSSSTPKLKHRQCAFDGQPLGQVGGRGLETSCWYLLHEGTASTEVPIHETSYTAWGQPRYVKTAGRGEQWLDYDEPSGFQAFVASETERVGDAGAPVTLLTSRAEWDAGFGAMTLFRDWNGQKTQVALDPLGRIERIYKPRAAGKEGCTEPSVRMSYVVGAPHSYVHTQAAEDDCDAGARLESRAYFDGLGRTRLKLAEGDGPGEWIASAYVTFDARGGEVQHYAPARVPSLAYAAPPTECPSSEADMKTRTDTEAPEWACPTTTWYDAFGRATRQLAADHESFTAVEYLPLAEQHFDEEDTDATSPHAGTPTVRYFDGHGRLVGVTLHNRTAGVDDLLPWAYAYDLLGNLLSITDPASNLKTQSFDSLGRQIGMVDPNAGAWSFAYDAAGNLTHYHDANGHDLYYGYDPANRLAWERHGSPTAANDVTYHYDAPHHLVGGVGRAPNGEPQHYVLGRLAWVEDPSGQRYASFDPRGRQTADVRTLVDPATSATLGTWVRHRVYDDLDREIAHLYPDGDQVAYEYSARGLLERVPGHLAQLDYNAAGQPVSRVLADGKATTATWRYDARQRLRSQQTLQNDTTILLSRTVDLDRAGNVIGIAQSDHEGLKPGETPPPAWLASFDLQVGKPSYDALYRLLGVGYSYHGTAPGRPTTEAYSHDRVGNLTGMLGDQSGFGAVTTFAGPYQATALQVAGEPTTLVTLAYDANGNVTTIASRDRNGADHRTVLTLSWDHNNHLVAIDRAEGTLQGPLTTTAAGRFAYDHAGQRAFKAVQRGTDPEDLTLYVAEDAEVRQGWQLTKYVFAGSERLAKVVDGNGTDDVLPGFKRYHFNYHPDLLHTAAVVTDDEGALVERRNYLPFGPPEADAPHPPYPTYHEPYGFTGKELDEDFGLQDYGARYLAPALGRWLSADPLYLSNPELGRDEPSHLNLYGYGLGRPLHTRDPDGQNPQLVFQTWMAAARAGFRFLLPPPARDWYDRTAADAHKNFNRTMDAAAVVPMVGGGVKVLKLERAARLEAEAVAVATRTRGAARLEAAGAKLATAARALASHTSRANKKPGAGSGVELRPYGGPGGGHHVPAKSAFRGVLGYDASAALAIPNAELTRLGVSHSAVSGAQMTGYRAFAQTGAPLTWDAAATIETNALVRGGMAVDTARATVGRAIQALQEAGVASPTRIPWGR